MPDQLFIGYDPGRGNTDVCVNGSVSSVQSVVALGGEDLVLDGLDAVVADAHAVHFLGQRYWVGQGAWAKGLVLQAMSDSALTAPNRIALLGAALAPHLDLTTAEPAEAVVAVGLPVTLLKEADQLAAIKADLGRLKGEVLEFEIERHCREGRRSHTTRTAHRVRFSRLFVQMQPVGAGLDWLLDDSLRVARQIQGEVLVVDIGMQTLDICSLLVNGPVVRPTEQHIAGAQLGVRWLLDQVDEPGLELAEKDARLRKGFIRFDPALMRLWINEIVDTLEKRIKSLRRFKAIILAGRGVTVAGRSLVDALQIRGAVLAQPDEPGSAVCRGLYKYAALKGRGGMA